MARPRGAIRRLAGVLGAFALVVGCRTVEGPFGGRDALVRRTSSPERADAWRYVVDAELQATALGADAAGTSLPAGLRAAVLESPGLRGTAEAHAVVEDVALPVPLGEAIWRNDAYRSPATLDRVWTGARVAVEWIVVVHHRGPTLVDVEAVPRLLHASGSVARLDEFRVVRRLALNDALAIGLDPAAAGAAEARALFGAGAAAAPADAPLRLVLRVRGGA